MQITITSTLTDEQAFILAKEKGYSEIVSTTINVDRPEEEVITSPNPQSPFDFLKNVYENMIKEDMKRLFISQSDRANVDKKIAREQILKDMVDNAFA